jgi:hypothetical protein
MPPRRDNGWAIMAVSFLATLGAIGVLSALWLAFLFGK